MVTAPPPLPADAPPEVAAFVSCRAEVLELRDGPVPWLPVPGAVRRVLGEGRAPHARVVPTPDPAWADLHVGWGPVSLRLLLGVVDGGLAVRFPRRFDPLTLALRDDVRAWVEQVNAWLAARGRSLAGPVIGTGLVILRKQGGADADTGPATVPGP